MCFLSHRLACTFFKFSSSPLSAVQGIARRPKPAHLSSRLLSRPTSAIDPLEPPCPALGNIYLSSCPGKKGVAHVTDAFGLGFH
jgi:hypothetical protein